VDTHATDLVGINGITRVLLVYSCQQGVYPRGHVLPLRLPQIFTIETKSRRRVSTGSIVSDYGLDDRAIGVRSPAVAKDFSSSLCVQTGLLYNRYRGSFLRG
jgi:hypothetical protein